MQGKKKDKYLLRLPNAPIMYLAGLYNSYPDPKTGKKYGAFVILTTQANNSMRAIHDRMPVILSPKDLPLWLYSHGEAEILLGEEGPELVSYMVV